MRSVHKGSLNFGLVNINVKLFTATESHDVKFHQHHGGDCLGSIRYNRVCEGCGEVVQYGDIVKGKEVEVGDEKKLVIINEDDIAALDTEQESAGLDVLEFVHADDIDPIMFERTYFLDADTGKTRTSKKENLGPARAYALLREALKESGKVGIVQFAMRQKTHMGVLRYDPQRNVLLLHTLLWADEVRDPGELVMVRKQFDVKPAEVKMALKVIDSLTSEWKPEQYTDTYSERLAEMVEAKAAGGEFHTETVEDTDDESDVSDLLAKLQASIEARELDESVQRHPAGTKKARKSA